MAISPLNPSLFKAFANGCIPHPRNGGADFANGMRKDISEDLRNEAWSALVALSKIPLSDPKLADMMQLLPPPSDPDFPEQCLGLMLLVDQGPRMLCNDIDGRWTDPFFGVLALRIARAWYALPPEQQPNAWARWKQAGVDFDYWVLVHFHFSFPFVHSEAEDNQRIGLAMTEERRAAVEEHTGETDPHRGERLELLSDTLGFYRVAMGGPPSGDPVTMHQWVFWSGMLLDVHWPIIHKYGRYPYRNPIQGRESTGEELAWLEKTDNAFTASPEVAEKVRQDVKQGIWTPLGPDPKPE